MMEDRNSSNQSTESQTHIHPTAGWKLLYGERGWAKLRGLLVLVALIPASALPAVWIEHIPFLRVWHNIVFPIIVAAIFFVVGIYMMRDKLEIDSDSSSMFLWALLLLILSVPFVLFEFLLIAGWVPPGPVVGRYALVPLAAFLAALFAGAKYIQDIYELENFSIAFLYLVSSQFGFAYPTLTIADGQRKIEIGKVNRLDLVGGPGYITVLPGDAALVQIHIHSSKVYSANTFFVPRFGKIVDVVNLQDQRASINEADAYTKDGIKITIRDIALRFRIWSDPPAESPTGSKHHHSKPYPYSPQAVRDRVFGLSVDQKGSTSWIEAVKGAVKGKITEYIASHQFDRIVTPDFQKGDPRKQIHDQLFTPETENRLKGIGAKLLWCDIGHFEEDREALRQHLETWSAKWIGNANVIRAEGEAQRIAYQELGRAEAQADMLTSIIHAFNDIDLSSENQKQNIRNVILMRTAQVLESLIDAKGMISQDKSHPAHREGDTNHYQEGQNG